MLTTLSLELGDSSADIRALFTTSLGSPYLQELTIQIAPQWQPLVTMTANEAKQSAVQIFNKLPKCLQEQLMATEFYLGALSWQAPSLRVLSAIDGGYLHRVLPTFPKLAHLVLDLWLPKISIDWACELPGLLTLRLNARVGLSGSYLEQDEWSVDLRPMTGLKHFSVTEFLPGKLWLPGSCQLHVGAFAAEAAMRMMYPIGSYIAPWVTRMEISRNAILGQGGTLLQLLGMDLHLDELTLRFEEIGREKEPLTISAASGNILTQAKQVTMHAKDINIDIPSNVNLAWVKVHMVAERLLLLSYKKPEVLLSGRATVMLQYSKTNLGNVHFMWRSIADRLGLSITKRDWKSEGKAMHSLCLSKGLGEDGQFLQAPRICRACMACLAYYGVL